MLRIILSAILGLVTPMLYMIGFALIAYTFQSSLSESVINPWIELFIYGESAPGILLIPVAIPEYIYIAAKANKLLPPQFFSDYIEFGFFVSLNWILYGSVIYLLLGRFKRFKKQLPFTFDVPPPPPQFESE